MQFSFKITQSRSRAKYTWTVNMSFNTLQPPCNHTILNSQCIMVIPVRKKLDVTLMHNMCAFVCVYVSEGCAFVIKLQTKVSNQWLIAWVITEVLEWLMHFSSTYWLVFKGCDICTQYHKVTGQKFILTREHWGYMGSETSTEK